jgi:hypothetical protein
MAWHDKIATLGPCHRIAEPQHTTQAVMHGHTLRGLKHAQLQQCVDKMKMAYLAQHSPPTTCYALQLGMCKHPKHTKNMVYHNQQHQPNMYGAATH